jgi:hypothetical protein
MHTSLAGWPRRALSRQSITSDIATRILSALAQAGCQRSVYLSRYFDFNQPPKMDFAFDDRSKLVSMAANEKFCQVLRLVFTLSVISSCT